MWIGLTNLLIIDRGVIGYIELYIIYDDCAFYFGGAFYVENGVERINEVDISSFYYPHIVIRFGFLTQFKTFKSVQFQLRTSLFIQDSVSTSS